MPGDSDYTQALILFAAACHFGCTTVMEALLAALAEGIRRNKAGCRRGTTLETPYAEDRPFYRGANGQGAGSLNLDCRGTAEA